MDYLEVETFYNLGVSVGGPYSLICASELHVRVRGTSLISPVGPFLPESIGDMNVNRRLFALVNKLPWLIKLQFKITGRMLKKDPDKFINLFKKKVQDSDRKMIESNQIRTLLKLDFLEAYRQGAAGSLYDCFIPANWPINLEGIKGPVEVWYGKLDRSIGDMGKYIGKKIPSAITHCIPNTGHFLVFEQTGEILKSLLQREPIY
jgi:pimeloyl-ACP methyl ester carboxylesterase